MSLDYSSRFVNAMLHLKVSVLRIGLRSDGGAWPIYCPLQSIVPSTPLVPPNSSMCVHAESSSLHCQENLIFFFAIDFHRIILCRFKRTYSSSASSQRLASRSMAGTMSEGFDVENPNLASVDRIRSSSESSATDMARSPSTSASRVPSPPQMHLRSPSPGLPVPLQTEQGA